MPITSDALIRIAKEHIIQVIRNDKSIVAIYLIGSVLTGDPLLGGATDIDLIFVHDKTPKVKREIVPVSPEVHLDIKHNPRPEYDKPRELRVHPWLGPEMWNPMLLYETGPFFEYVQAGVRDKFHDPVSLLQRSRTNLGHARQLWSDLFMGEESDPPTLLKYLKTVNHVANAVAILNGPVLAERRFLLQFPERAEAAGNKGFANRLLYQLGEEYVDNETILGFLPVWEKTFIEAAGRSKVDGRIHKARLAYYKKAFEAMIESGNVTAVLWPLLFTWTLAAFALPASKQATWSSAFKFFGLLDDGLQTKLETLSTFMDDVDETLNMLAAANGLDAIYRDGRRVV